MLYDPLSLLLDVENESEDPLEDEPDDSPLDPLKIDDDVDELVFDQVSRSVVLEPV